MKHDFSYYIDSIDYSPVILDCAELPLLVSNPKTNGLLDPMRAAINYVVK